MDISSLEKKIGIKFNNPELLKQALVHRSYLNENPDFYLGNNERLEFLGDAVLELTVTAYLYNNYPNPEGELTNWRAALVNTKMLSRLAQELKLNDHILLSKGEAKDVGKARQCILADAFEALVGALYLDQGYEKITDFVEKKVIKKLPEVIKEKLYQDPKSHFQEEAQEKKGITPIYEVLKEWGPDHAKNFIVGVYLEKELVAEGQGKSKQEAQTKAAENGLKKKGWN